MTIEMIPAWVNGVLQPVEKLQVHRQGLRHKAVSVFVIHDERILLQQRATGKYHSAGLWANSCCTHPIWGEDAVTCAQRRLAQELGIERLPVLSMGQVEYRAKVGGGMTEHEVVQVFLGIAVDPPVLRLDPAEVAATRWATLAELDHDLASMSQSFVPWLHLYMTEHRAQIFGSDAG